MPPNTAAPTGPSTRATTPLSNSPSSLEPEINSPDTEDTRPRIWSGVTICTSVWRTYIDTMSAAPRIASANIDSGIDFDTANSSVAAPNTATDRNMRRPAMRASGQRFSASAISAAPIAGPERSIPNPSGPTFRISLANAGKSAVAPPSNTANRSSEIAPKMILLVQT
ncbi:hypothetical protein GALL_502060 [mine drainage metagenome]|uniref:Uncharacterized protein n=1 Tax=mine drainage metagenome TaxID=410659 RepID=A0A1J5PK79_9ZZZZ